MRKWSSFLKFQIVSAIFVIALGTVLHFTFQWSDGNKIVGLFSAVNESTWEHLKLIFYPMIITTIVGNYIFGEKIICAKTAGIITAMLFTVIFFYTYTGIIGTNYAFLNIATFIISVILVEYVTYRLYESNVLYNPNICTIILIILLICFIIFTFNAPKINLFKDPITGLYGI